jgi:hypothetical protein
MTTNCLPPLFYVQQTKKFSVISEYHKFLEEQQINPSSVEVFIDWECEYTRELINQGCQRRPWCKILSSLPISSPHEGISKNLIQIADFENIQWESVLNGHHQASSYFIRKGLSRKAQLALQIRRYLTKHPTSHMKKHIPFTLIIDTWSAFDTENVSLDIGGGFYTNFDLPELQNANLSDRLRWCLMDIQNEMKLYNQQQQNQQNQCEEQEEQQTEGIQTIWILKPSVTNKGLHIHLILDFDHLISILSDYPNIREWVLQVYVDRPLLLLSSYPEVWQTILPYRLSLLSSQSSYHNNNNNTLFHQLYTKYPRYLDHSTIDYPWSQLLQHSSSFSSNKKSNNNNNNTIINKGHKFHVRMYILCVGALQVFVYNPMLLLFAAKPYYNNSNNNLDQEDDDDDDDDLYAHLTNTAHNSQSKYFQDGLYIQSSVAMLPHLLYYHQQQQQSTQCMAPLHSNNLNTTSHHWQWTKQQIDSCYHQMKCIVSELFVAYENEYSIFCPMSQCFELFGLDFMIDENYIVYLLETNPGPDFKQTGDQLKYMIAQLWEETLRVVIDLSAYRTTRDNDNKNSHKKSREYVYHEQNKNSQQPLSQRQGQDKSKEEEEEYYQLLKTIATNFTLVYDKEWSVSRLTSSMTLS